MKNAWALAAAALVALPALAGCASSGPQPDVMASFYPLQFLTERIVGADLLVGVVVKSGTEPHDYEPTPVDLARIAGAQAVIIQGAGFESWIQIASKQAGAKNLVVATQDIALRAPATEEEAAESAQDPHTWLDPLLAIEMARTIERSLERSFPDRAAALRTNLANLVADLQELHAEFQAGLMRCATPFIVTNHAAFSYLAARYNFTMISISGLDPNEEPNPQALAAVIEEARAHNVTTIFYEELVSPRVAEAVAREVGATVRVLSPIEGIAEDEQAEGKDYLAVMRENLEALRFGMNCP